MLKNSITHCPRFPEVLETAIPHHNPAVNDPDYHTEIRSTMFRVIFLSPPVIEPGGARVGVAGQALHVFEWHALLQQIGDGRDAERMRREARGQARVFQPPLHHPADVHRRAFAFSVSRPVFRMAVRKRGVSLRASRSPAASMYSKSICSRSWRTGISRRLAAFLLEVEHPLVAGVIEAAAAEPGHGAGAGGGVDQDGEDGAIAETDHGSRSRWKPSSFRAPSR